MLKIVQPILLAILLGYTEASRLKGVYTVEINERGTHFNESVEIDEREKTVLYKVPDHNDVVQSEVLFDYKTGYFATRIPKLKECFIQRIPKDQSSLAQVKKSLQLQQEMMKRDKYEIPVSTVIAAKTVKERKIEPTELNPRFLTFCGNYEAYEVKEISHKALDMNGQENNGKIREKRSEYDIPFVPDITQEKGFEIMIRHLTDPDKWTKITVNSCRKLMLYVPSLEQGGCAKNPDSWEYHCGAKTRTCIYSVQCRMDDTAEIRCVEKHYYTGWTCCDIYCP